MTDPTARALIQRLADELERAQSDLYFNGGCTDTTDKKRRNILAEARAYLAQPEPNPPTDEEIDKVWEDLVGYCALYEEVRNTVRASLARWGRPS